MKKTALTSFTILYLLSTVFLMGLAFNVQQVKAGPTTWTVDDDGPADFHTIQEAINAGSDGDTVFVFNGTYYENVVVNKSLSLVGENKSNTLIDGNGTGTVVNVLTNNIVVSEFTIQNGTTGVYSSYSYLNLNNNNITNNAWGVHLRASRYDVISENIIAYNIEWGVIGEASYKNFVDKNLISHNGFDGIFLFGYSNDNIISRNLIENNSWAGIDFYYGYSDNVIIGNILANNQEGIRFKWSSNDKVHYNSFINNTVQVHLENSENIWDDGYPAGGNYWNDYTDVDLNHDGIGDSAYILDANNTDRYPLMGMFSSFNTSLRCNMNVVSNSTIEDFEYFESNSTIKMYVSGEEGLGFCRVCLPHVLMNVSSISVVIDNGQTSVLYHNYTLYDNDTHRWIYFAYEHSTHEVDIIPEFPSITVFLLLIIFASIVVTLSKRKMH